MTFKQKGFPMHSTKSALKQTEEPGLNIENLEEETVPTPPKYPKIKVDDEGHQTMLTWDWEVDPKTGKRTKVPRYERF